MVVSEIDKLRFLETIFLFSGSFALLWYSIIKAKIEFPLKYFLTFTAGLLFSLIIVSYLLKKLLTTYRSEM